MDAGPPCLCWRWRDWYIAAPAASDHWSYDGTSCTLPQVGNCSAVESLLQEDLAPRFAHPPELLVPALTRCPPVPSSAECAGRTAAGDRAASDVRIRSDSSGVQASRVATWCVADCLSSGSRASWELAQENLTVERLSSDASFLSRTRRLPPTSSHPAVQIRGLPAGCCPPGIPMESICAI